MSIKSLFAEAWGGLYEGSALQHQKPAKKRGRTTVTLALMDLYGVAPMRPLERFQCDVCFAKAGDNDSMMVSTGNPLCGYCLDQNEATAERLRQAEEDFFAECGDPNCFPRHPDDR